MICFGCYTALVPSADFTTKGLWVAKCFRCGLVMYTTHSPNKCKHDRVVV